MSDILFGILPFLLSTATATAITPLVIKWYRARGWVEDPRAAAHVKTTHDQPVPRGGGIIIFTSILLSAMVFLQWDWQLLAIMGAAALLMIIGTLDDIYDIHPFIRLVAGTLAGIIVAGAGIGIAYVTNPFAAGVIHLDQPQLVFDFLGETRNIWIIADIFAVLFIVWNMNIVNWANGLDGQMPGFVAIAALFIGLLSTQFLDDPTQFNTVHLSFSVAGAFAGLLLWNRYPQKIITGYGAGSLGGFFLAVLAILGGAKLATTLMVLAIPTADAIFTILRRLRARKSPFWGDRGHLHHKLIDVLGWSKRRIAWVYWGASLLLGILSLFLSTWGKIAAIVLTMGTVFGFLIWAKLQTRETV